MVGEERLLIAVIDFWVKDSGSDCASLYEARERPGDYWVITTLSQATKLKPEQVIDALIARVSKKPVKIERSVIFRAKRKPAPLSAEAHIRHSQAMQKRWDNYRKRKAEAIAG